jgi:hypothetical protein
MKFSQESLDKLSKIFKEDFKTDMTDRELYDAAFNLTGFYDTLMKCAFKDIQNHLRLEKEPEGYRPEGDGYGTCSLCGYDTAAIDSWVDKNGFKCKFCQKAVNEGIIPGLICRNKDRWFSFETLKGKFGIHPATARSLVRKGELKSRVIMNDTSKPHFTVFLREDNYQFLKIDKDVPPSDLEEYDKDVAKWAEDYKQKMAEQRTK